ncbi:hypothetical protein FRC10_007779 [Ceratobasidium sp. 414]|nr:hypothetical protein FRC10_007779 [Ceratobasidium sp. 414]
MSPSSQESSLHSNVLRHPPFRAMEDLDLWQKYLGFQDTQAVNQFIRLCLKHRGAPCTMANHQMTEQSLGESFLQVDTDFFAGVREARASLVLEANQARHDLQKAKEAAQAAEEALQDVTTKHNSLLQHLNIRDNTELSDVVHQFRGLNDDIDGFSLEVAQILPQDRLERYPDCTRCHNPDGLRGLLNQPSHLLLFQSRAGVPMAAQQFLELFTASVVCWALCVNIFGSFYPLSPGDPEVSAQFETLEAVYDELRLQNQQMASAKWRIETYSSLIKLDSMRDGRVAAISAHIAASINPAITHLFGVEIIDLANHPRLVKLVTRALDLNHMIKAEVTHAGDVHAGYFPFNNIYDDSCMKVMDAKKGAPLPKRIVSTCGLGVCLTKAVGGGKEPEFTVLLKAVVSSEDIYG